MIGSDRLSIWLFRFRDRVLDERFSKSAQRALGRKFSHHEQPGMEFPR